MEFNEIMEQIVQFTKERDWDQFHNGKDLALALSIEASELNEVFLWKKPEEVNGKTIKEELADVIVYCQDMLDKLNLDVDEIVNMKMEQNEAKYPVEKAKGSAKKYIDL